MQHKEVFYGWKEKELLEKLGNPDQVARNGDLIYFVEPGNQCFRENAITDAVSVNV